MLEAALRGDFDDGLEEDLLQDSAEPDLVGSSSGRHENADDHESTQYRDPAAANRSQQLDAAPDLGPQMSFPYRSYPSVSEDESDDLEGASRITTESNKPESLTASPTEVQAGDLHAKGVVDLAKEPASEQLDDLNASLQTLLQESGELFSDEE